MTLSLEQVRDALDRAEDLFVEVGDALDEGNSHDWYDPGYDVEFAEDLSGAYAQDRDVNNLAATAYALRAGLPVIAWTPALRNPGEDERVLRATRQFTGAAQVLINEFINGALSPADFGPAIAAAYTRQARNAFMAGKRALGNLSPLTLADERSIATVVASAGFSGVNVPPGSLGGFLAQLVGYERNTSPNARRDQARFDQALTTHVDARLAALMAKGYQVASTERRAALSALLAGRQATYASSKAQLEQLAASPDQLKAYRLEVAKRERLYLAAKRAHDALVARAAADRKKLEASMAAAIATARSRIRAALAKVRRDLLSGKIAAAAAAAAMNAILQTEKRRAFTTGKRLALAGVAHAETINRLQAALLTPEDLAILDQEQRDAERAWLADFPAGPTGVAAGGIGAFLAKNILSPQNLIDPDIGKAIWHRLSGAEHDFHALKGAGEKAAFRLGGMGVSAPAATDLEVPAAQRLSDWMAPQGSDTSSAMDEAVIVWWTLSEGVQNCDDCIALSDDSPYYLAKLEEMNLAPGSGHTQCGGNCRCHFEFDVPSTVCGDTLVMDDLTMMESAGPIENVWVMEADSCGNPVDVGSFAAAATGMGAGAINYLSDGQALSWDADVAGRILMDRPGLALPESLKWLSTPPEGHPPYLIEPGVNGAGPALVQHFSLDGSTFAAVLQDDALATHFVTGAMTAGTGAFAPEFNIAALRWAADHAATQGKQLVFDERLVNNGMRDFLDQIGATPATFPVPLPELPRGFATETGQLDLALPWTEPPLPVVDLAPLPEAALRPTPDLPAFEKVGAVKFATNDHAIVQVDFKPARSAAAARQRLHEAWPLLGPQELPAFSLDQLNSLTARGELLSSLGVDTTRLRELDMLHEMDPMAGEAFAGGLVKLRLDPGLAAFSTEANAIGDILGHEYGHVLQHAMEERLGTERVGYFTTKFAEANKGRLRQYADTNPREFWAEAFSVMTRPDYVAGTLERDGEAWAMLKDAGLWQPRERVIPKGVVADAALGLPAPPVLDNLIANMDTGALVKGWKHADPETLSGGGSPRHLFRDPSGQEWLWKSNGSEAEVAGARVTRLFGFNAPPVGRVRYGDEWGSMQPIIPNVESYWKRAPSIDSYARLQTNEVRDLTGNAFIDWITHNADGHPGNYMVGEGRIWSIDKGNAFTASLEDVVKLDEFYRQRAIGSIFNTLMQPQILIGKLQPGDVVALLARFDQVGHDALVAAAGDAIRSPAMKAEMLRRKDALRGEVEAMFRDRVAQAGPAGEFAGASSEWKAWLSDGGHFPAEALGHAPEEFGIKGMPAVADLLNPKISRVFHDFRPADIRHALAGAPQAERDGASQLFRNVATVWAKDVSVVPTEWQVWLVKGGTFEHSEVLPPMKSLWSKGSPTDGLAKGVPIAKPAPFVDTPFAGDTFLVPKDPPAGLVPELIPVPGSDLPLNAPLVEWSGKVPTEPPIPKEAVPDWQIKDLRDKANEAWLGYKDVQSGDVAYAITYSQSNTEAAKKAGLFTEKLKDGQYYAAKDEASMKALRDAVEGGLDTGTDDFWKTWLGYDDRRLSAIDTYEAVKKGSKSLRAGAVVVEPDGRVWFMAPRNRFGGYENTWSKGGVDAGETPAMTAVRELKEEMGLSVELDGYIGDFASPGGGAINRYYLAHRTGGGPAFAKVKETYSIRLGTPAEVRPVLKQYGKLSTRDTAVLDTYLQQAGLPPVAPTIEEVLKRPEAKGESLGFSIDDVAQPSTGVPLSAKVGFDASEVDAASQLFMETGAKNGIIESTVNTPIGTVSTYHSFDQIGNRTWSSISIDLEKGAPVGSTKQLVYTALAGQLRALESGATLTIGFSDPVYLSILSPALEQVVGAINVHGAVTLTDLEAAQVLKLITDPTAVPGAAATIGISASEAGKLAAKLAPEDPLAGGPLHAVTNPAAFAVDPVAPSPVAFSTQHGIDTAAYGNVVMTNDTAGATLAGAEADHAVTWAVGGGSKQTFIYKEFYGVTGNTGIYMKTVTYTAMPPGTQLAVTLRALRRNGGKILASPDLKYLRIGKDYVSANPALADIFTAVGATPPVSSGIGLTAWQLDKDALAKLSDALDSDLPIPHAAHVPAGALDPAAGAVVQDPSLAHVAPAAATPPPAVAPAVTGTPLSTQYAYDPVPLADVWSGATGQMYDLSPGFGTGVYTTSHYGPGGVSNAIWDISSSGNLRFNDLLTAPFIGEEAKSHAVLAQLHQFVGFMKAPIDGKAEHLAIRFDDQVLAKMPAATRQLLEDSGLKQSTYGGWTLGRSKAMQLDQKIGDDLAKLAPAGPPPVGGGFDILNPGDMVEWYVGPTKLTGTIVGTTGTNLDKWLVKVDLPGGNTTSVSVLKSHPSLAPAAAVPVGPQIGHSVLWQVPGGVTKKATIEGVSPDGTNWILNVGGDVKVASKADVIAAFPAPTAAPSGLYSQTLVSNIAQVTPDVTYQVGAAGAHQGYGYGSHVVEWNLTVHPDAANGAMTFWDMHGPAKASLNSVLAAIASVAEKGETMDFAFVFKPEIFAHVPGLREVIRPYAVSDGADLFLHQSTAEQLAVALRDGTALPDPTQVTKTALTNVPAVPAPSLVNPPGGLAQKAGYDYHAVVNEQPQIQAYPSTAPKGGAVVIKTGADPVNNAKAFMGFTDTGGGIYSMQLVPTAGQISTVLTDSDKMTAFLQGVKAVSTDPLGFGMVRIAVPADALSKMPGSLADLLKQAGGHEDSTGTIILLQSHVDNLLQHVDDDSLMTGVPSAGLKPTVSSGLLGSPSPQEVSDIVTAIGTTPTVGQASFGDLWTWSTSQGELSVAVFDPQSGISTAALLDSTMGGESHKAVLAASVHLVDKLEALGPKPGVVVALVFRSPILDQMPAGFIAELQNVYHAESMLGGSLRLKLPDALKFRDDIKAQLGVMTPPPLPAPAHGILSGATVAVPQAPATTGVTHLAFDAYDALPVQNEWVMNSEHTLANHPLLSGSNTVMKQAVYGAPGVAQSEVLWRRLGNGLQLWDIKGNASGGFVYHLRRMNEMLVANPKLTGVSIKAALPPDVATVLDNVLGAYDHSTLNPVEVQKLVDAFNADAVAAAIPAPAPAHYAFGDVVGYDPALVTTLSNPVQEFNISAPYLKGTNTTVKRVLFAGQPPTDFVEWRRLGNRLELWVASAQTVETQTNMVLAHIRRMGDLLDGSPKLDGLRFASPGSYDQSLIDRLHKLGAKDYSGGLFMERDQVIAARDLLKQDAGMPVTQMIPAPPPPPPFSKLEALMPEYDAAKAPLLVPDFEKSITAGFLTGTNTTIKFAEYGKAGAVEWRRLGNNLQIFHIVNGVASQAGDRMNIILGHINRMADLMTLSPKLETLTFKMGLQVPGNLRDVLVKEFGAVHYGLDDRLVLTRDQVLEVQKALSHDHAIVTGTASPSAAQFAPGVLQGPGPVAISPPLAPAPLPTLTAPTSPLFVPVSAPSAGAVTGGAGPIIPDSEKLSAKLGYDHAEMQAAAALGSSDLALGSVTKATIPQTAFSAAWIMPGGKTIDAVYAVSPTGKTIAFTEVRNTAKATAQEVRDSTYASLLRFANETATKATDAGQAILDSKLYVTTEIMQANPGMEELLKRIGGTEYLTRPASGAKAGEGGKFFDAYGAGIRLNRDQSKVLVDALNANTENVALQGQVLAAIPPPPKLSAVPAGVKANEPVSLIGGKGAPDTLWLAGTEVISAKGLRAVSTWADGKVEAEWLQAGAVLQWADLRVSGATVAETHAAVTRTLDSLLEHIASNPGMVLEVDANAYGALPELRDLLLRYNGHQAITPSREFIRLNSQDAALLRTDIDRELGALAPAGVKPVVPPVIWPSPTGLKAIPQPGLPPTAVSLTAVPPTPAQLKVLQDPAKAFEKPPDPADLTATGSSVSGLNANATWPVLVDGKGNEWIFKAARSTSGLRDLGPVRLYSDTLSTKMFAYLGLNTPSTVEFDWQGVHGYIQRKAEAIGKAPVEHLESATPAVREELQRQHVVDWWLGQHDSNAAGMLLGKDGRLVAVDKGQAFKFYGQDWPPRWSYSPNPNDVTNDFLKAFTDRGGKLDWSAIEPTLQRIEAIPEADLRTMYRPLADAREADGRNLGGTAFLDELTKRRDELRSSFEKLYADAGQLVPAAPVASLPVAATVTFKDAAGVEWLFRPAEAATTHAEVAAAELAGHLGLRVPPVKEYVLNVDGKATHGTLQKLIAGAGSVKSVSALTPGQMDEMLQHSVLDWLIGNNDAHLENFMADADGHLWAKNKASAWTTMGTKVDSLDPALTGTATGLPPLVNLFWRDVRKDPAILKNVSPRQIARTLGNLDALPDTEFLRIVTPVLRDSAAYKQYRTAEDFRVAVLSRKRTVKSDLERQFAAELRTAIAKPGGKTLVPDEWSKWLADGGTFKPALTPRDIWEQKIADLDRDFGAFSQARLRELIDPHGPSVANRPAAQSLTKVRDLIHRYSGGGLGGGGYGAEKLAGDSAAYRDAYEYLTQVNNWAMLHILNDTGITATMANMPASVLADLRKAWRPDEGKLLLVRGVTRAQDPVSYLAKRTREGFRSGLGSGVIDSQGVGHWSGMQMYVKVDIENVYTSTYTMPGLYSLGQGEREVLIRDLRLDQVIRMMPYGAGHWWEQEARKRGMDVWDYMWQYSGAVATPSMLP